MSDQPKPAPKPDDTAGASPDAYFNLVTIVPKAIGEQSDGEARAAGVTGRRVCNEKLARPYGQPSAYQAATAVSLN